VAAWIADISCNIYLVKNHTIAKNSTTSQAIGKIATDLESLEFYKKNCCMSDKILRQTKFT
jgi:hypothetical protein